MKKLKFFLVMVLCCFSFHLCAWANERKEDSKPASSSNAEENPVDPSEESKSENTNEGLRADSRNASEKASSEWKYTINSSKTGIILDEYKGMETNIVIPESIDGMEVTELGWRLFYGTGIESVEMPDTVEKLGDWLFCDCTELTYVKLSNNC